MANIVNLDALIPREDLSVLSGDTDVSKIDTLQIRDLEEGTFFYNALRKPDFQRETGSWSPNKVVDLVQTFLNGDLIPAVILWRSGNNVFVIDGAHRLSALIAWVQDDYGAGSRSNQFFQGLVPEDQKKAAAKTRSLMDAKIGTYAEHVQANTFPQNAKEGVLDRSRRLGVLAIQLQWVRTGDAVKAADSFFKINQAATSIDPVELRILKSRNSALAVASRAIARGATGHRYWGHFADNLIKKNIEEVAKQTHDALYAPPYAEPVKTLDLPMAGPVYIGQNLPLIFDLVNFSNGRKLADSTKSGASDHVEDDVSGTETYSFLSATRKLVGRLTGTDPSSLGLHPALYCYSAAGSFQHSAFMGVCDFVSDLEKSSRLFEFTDHRGKFEDFFLTNKDLISEVIHKFGSGSRSAPWVKKLYEFVLDRLKGGKVGPAILADLSTDVHFSALLTAAPDGTIKLGGKFTRRTKSAAFLRDALNTALRCPLCGGLMHRNSMSVDHIERRADGGSDSLGNAQMTHPFCNSTVKG